MTRPSTTAAPPRSAGGLAAVAAIARWPNALIAAAGVALGAWWSADRLLAPEVGLAMLAAVSLATFANVINDLHDVEIDRVAHPGRPLPRGLLSPHTAWQLAAVAAGVALVSSALATPPLGALTAGVLAAMYAYSRWIKRLGFPGNALVAVIASLPFLYGGAAAGAWRASLALVVLAVPLHLAREIAKDLDDAVGDAATRRTLPVVHGARIARVALAVALLAFCAALLPWVALWPQLGALITPALVVCGLGAHRSLTGRPGGPTRLKAAMLLAMAALVAVRVLHPSP